MPKVICKKIGCKKLIEKGINSGYCDEHKEAGVKLKQEADRYRMKQYNQGRKDSKETEFYNKHWSPTKTKALTRDNYMCQECKKNGKYITDNLEVHHIVPIKENFDLALDLGNLITLCRSCHKKAHDKLNNYKIK